jgi:hypothetical protein
VCANSSAQLKIGVSSDRAVYHVGDTVFISVTAFNTTTDTVSLHFGSTLQAYYIVDSYNLLDYAVGAAILTSKRIPPQDSVVWTPPQYPRNGFGQPPLTTGSHILVGGVIGYGKSDTTRFTVIAPTHVSPEPSSAVRFSLDQNYPNPFNGGTWVSFTLDKTSQLDLSLYNVLGQKIRTVLTGRHTAGTHLTAVDAEGLPSGPIWCRLQVDGSARTIRMLYVK